MHASPPAREGRRSFACISSGIATVIQVPGGAIKGTITDLMSHSQFHCTGRVYLDLHGLIFETSICYWQDQPGSPRTGRGMDHRSALVSYTRVSLRCGYPPEGTPRGAAAHRATCGDLPRSGERGETGGWPLIEAVTGKSVLRGAGRRADEGRTEPTRASRTPLRPPVADHCDRPAV